MTKESLPWENDVQLPSYNQLQTSVDTDVVIIGGGITGLTCAYLLATSGLKVIVIEKNTMGQGVTSATTAFLTEYIDTMLHELISMFGKEDATKIIHSHAMAIDDIEHIIQTEHIDCNFQRCPIYVYANEEKELKTLGQERDAAQEIELALMHDDTDLNFPNAGYLPLQNQAQFNPMKYIAGLLSALTRLGVQLFDTTEALSIKENIGITVASPLANIQATYAIVATYAPFDKELHFKKAFYDTYVQEVRLRHGSLPIGIYEDTLDPYHYFRIDQVDAEYDRMLIGGEDHRSDIPVDHEKHFRAVEEYTKKILPSTPYTVIRKWKGPIIESIDGLAWIGNHKEKRLFYTTGFSGNGMTYSMIAARIISDSIQKKSNPWSHIYSIDRVPTLKQLAYKGKDYTNELLGGAIKDLFIRT